MLKYFNPDHLNVYEFELVLQTEGKSFYFLNFYLHFIYGINLLIVSSVITFLIIIKSTILYNICKHFRLLVFR